MNATRLRAKPVPIGAGGALAGATRGRARNYTQMLGLIHQAAIEVFAADGLAGASTKAIADKAGLSKAQLHYYIESKEMLYRQVLQDIVDDWIGVFGFSDEPLGPRKVLTELIQRRMQFSFDHPLRSRIFTAEMMRGAPMIREMMGPSGPRMVQAVAVVRNWIQRGLMDAVDPLLFLFHLWATTQFYADHAAQVAFFRDASMSTEKDRRYLTENVTDFLLKAAGVR
jgi:TetR/AcrR family transcriptional regulator